MIEPKCITSKNQRKSYAHKKPEWKIEIEKEIEKEIGFIREEISMLDYVGRVENVNARKAMKIKKNDELKTIFYKDVYHLLREY